MGTEIALTNTYDAALAALLGQNVNAGNGGLPRLAINTDHVIEIDGQDFNVPAGAFKVRIDGTTVFGKDVTLRPFMQRYFWSKFDASANNGKGGVVAQSIMVPDFRTEPVDDQGGVACGKLRGQAAKDEANLSPAQKLIQKAVQTYRIVYGTVTIADAKNVHGDPVEVKDFPVELRLRGVNFMPFGDLENKITRTKQFLPQIALKLTTKREKKGSTVFYIIGFDYDPLNLLPIGATDLELIRQFNEHINVHNNTVLEKHKDALKTRSAPAEAVAEDGLDADFGEEGTEIH